MRRKLWQQRQTEKPGAKVIRYEHGPAVRQGVMRKSVEPRGKHSLWKG